MTRSTFPILFALLFQSEVTKTQQVFQYKEVGNTQLFMEVLYPKQTNTSISYLALVFFFGGGWARGTRAHFEQ